MKITIYTVNDCQFSKQEKDYLNSNKIAFEEKNLETNREFLTEMLAVSNNFAGTPVTKIEKDDGQIVVLKGFTKEEFNKALGLASTTDTTPVSPTQPTSTPTPTTPEPTIPTEPTPPAPSTPKVPEPEPPPPPTPPPTEPPTPPPPAPAEPPKPAGIGNGGSIAATPANGGSDPLASILEDLKTKSSSSTPPSVPDFPAKV